VISLNHKEKQSQTTHFIRKSTDFVSLATKFFKKTFEQVGSPNSRMQLRFKLVKGESQLNIPQKDFYRFRFQVLPLCDKSLEALPGFNPRLSTVDVISIFWYFKAALLFSLLLISCGQPLPRTR
jgi:hypothetical protein